MSNTVHGGSDSPFYPPPNALMPPQDIHFQPAFRAPENPPQGLPMYPQVMIAVPVFPNDANDLPFKINHTSLNGQHNGTSTRYGHPGLSPLDAPQAYVSGNWSRSGQALNTFDQDSLQGYSTQILQRDQQNLPNQGGTVSTNTFSSLQRFSATEFPQSPGSQATAGNLGPPYRQAYRHEPYLCQQQSPSWQSMGNRGPQVSSPAPGSEIQQECLNQQYNPTADAAKDYDPPNHPGASTYDDHQTFLRPPQLGPQSVRNLSPQATSMARDSGVVLHFPSLEHTSNLTRGGGDSTMDHSGVAHAIQPALPGFPQKPIDQLMGTINPALSGLYPHNAGVEDNVNSTLFGVHSQQRELPRTNPNGFDDRWLRQPENMWNLATRRTSHLTISPGDMTPETQENIQASAEEARTTTIGAERRESRFKALQLFDSSSEHSTQHEELATENGRQVETLEQQLKRQHAITVSQAYSRLNIYDHTLDDCMVLVTYFRSGFSSPSQIAELREALITVAEHRDSPYLKKFLSSGGGYCNPEDNEEQRTILEADAAGEHRCDGQSVTTISSSPDKTLTAANLTMRTPEPSIGSDEASPVLKGRPADVCNQNLSGAIMLKRAEARLASLNVASSHARVAKSEVSSDGAEGGIRLDAGKTSYPAALEKSQQAFHSMEQSLLKEDDLPDPYFMPRFDVQADAYKLKSILPAASALAPSLSDILSTHPGGNGVNNAILNRGHKVNGVERAYSPVATVRQDPLQHPRAEPQSTLFGSQVGPANPQNFVPQPNQLYRPIFDSDGQVQWQAYNPGIVMPPSMLPQQLPHQQHQPQLFPPQQQRFPPQPMHFYGNQQVFPPQLTNYMSPGAPQLNQSQQAMAQGYQGIPPQQFTPQQFAPQQFVPTFPHQRFPQGPSISQQYQPYNMPPDYGAQFVPSHLHPDPRIQALPPHFWSAPSAGFHPAELSTRTSGDPTRMERYGPDTQLVTRPGAPLPNRPTSARQGAVVSTLPVLPYQPATDTMYPRSVGGASVRLQELTRNGQPAYETAMNSAYLPFVETAREARPAEWGVLHVGNIPYIVTKAEILAHLGRNAKIITPDLGCAVHIIMDRATAKTMDCFVEFFSFGDAQAVVNKYKRTCDDGRHPRLGDRYVEMKMSTQDELMKELFPRAKNVSWIGGDPEIVGNDEPYNSGFKSFITGEELVMMVKHAEQPHRSPYSMKCPQRTYECMISTLHKFPWWSTTNYTLSDRNKLYTATHDLLAALVRHLKHAEHGSGSGIAGLTESLLTDLLYAGLNAPGFSERQRSGLLLVSEWAAVGVRVSPLAKWWPFEALGRRKRVDEDVVEFYACLISSSNTTTTTATPPIHTPPSSTHSPSLSRSLLPPASSASSPFGTFVVDLAPPPQEGDESKAATSTGTGTWKGYRKSKGSAKGSGTATGMAGMTLKEVAENEWKALEEALGGVLGE